MKTSDSLQSLLEPIQRSPQLIEAVAMLNEQVEEEQRRRGKFYAEMTPEQKVEFIDGEVVLHPPARSGHITAALLLSKLMNTYVDAHDLGMVSIEKSLCVFPRNDYEPDVAFFGTQKAHQISIETLKFPVPDLIVEILSPSTEARDRGVKFEDYEQNNVHEYWIIDADEQVIEQYVLRDGTFELKMKSASGDIECEAITGFKIPIAAIFDRPTHRETLRELLQ